eukprot:12360602-Alexandrium_andersonii.AAC.1
MQPTKQETRRRVEDTGLVMPPPPPSRPASVATPRDSRRASPGARDGAGQTAESPRPTAVKTAGAPPARSTDASAIRAALADPGLRNRLLSGLPQQLVDRLDVYVANANE